MNTDTGAAAPDKDPGPTLSDYGEPILLTGMPRSGTTWFGKLFDSHPDTLYLHEPDSIRPEIIKLSLAPTADAITPAQVRDYLRRLLAVRAPKVTGKLPLFRKAYQRADQHYLRNLWIYGNKLAARSGRSLKVPDLVGHGRRHRVRPVWKSIDATGRLNLLAPQFPGHIFVLVRHPCGQIGSTLRGESLRKFDSNTLTAQDHNAFRELIDGAGALADGLTMATLRGLSSEQRLAWRWRLVNDIALARAEAAPDRIIVVRYEDLCADPLTTIRGLFARCGLSPHPQTETFIGASTGHSDDGYYSVYKNPLQAARQWRQELSEAQVAQIRDVVIGGPSGRLFADDF